MSATRSYFLYRRGRRGRAQKGGWSPSHGGREAGGVWLAALDEVGCETDGQRKANINMAWMTAKHPLHKHALNGLVHDNDFIVRGVAREHDARSRASLTRFLLSFTTEAVLVGYRFFACFLAMALNAIHPTAAMYDAGTEAFTGMIEGVSPESLQGHWQRMACPVLLSQLPGSISLALIYIHTYIVDAEQRRSQVAAVLMCRLTKLHHSFPSRTSARAPRASGGAKLPDVVKRAG